MVFYSTGGLSPLPRMEIGDVVQLQLGGWQQTFGTTLLSDTIGETYDLEFEMCMTGYTASLMTLSVYRVYDGTDELLFRASFALPPEQLELVLAEPPRWLLSGCPTARRTVFD